MCVSRGLADVINRSDSEPFQIADAGKSDLDALAGLFNAYHTFYGCEPDIGAARHFVAFRLEQRSTRFLIARLTDSAVGFAHLLPSFDTLAMKKAWILEDLFVDPLQRRRGVGAALLRHAERFARQAGAVRVSLTTAHTNVTAQRLYVACGYTLDEVFRAYSLHISARRDDVRQPMP